MRYFKIGCYIFLFVGFSHLVGHFLPIKPQNDIELELLDLMKSYQKPVLGGYMSMMDIQNGLSLCYSLFFFYCGAVNLYLLRNSSGEVLLRSISGINAIAMLTGIVISLLYFFWLPLISFLSLFIFFSISYLKLGRVQVAK